jgi:hypothetical protein
MAMKNLSLAVLATASLSLGGGCLSAAIAGATISKHTASIQLANDEVTVGAAMTTFSKRAKKLTGASTPAQDRAVANPLASAMRRFQRSLLNQSWPSYAKVDVRRVYLACSPVIAALLTESTVSHSDSTSVSAWVSKIGTDLEIWIGDVNIANHDLGLPIL